MISGTVIDHRGRADRAERHLELRLPVKNAIAAETGRTLRRVVSVIASRNSFQTKMNASSPAVTSPGAASGSTILRKAWKWVAPSTSAASSSSCGISRKNEMRM